MIAAGLCGCSGLDDLDRRTERLLAEATRDLGTEAATPELSWTAGASAPEFRDPRSRSERPTSANPPASALEFGAVADTEHVQERLEGYNAVPPDAWNLDLTGALAYAIRHGREYRFAEEQFILAVLSLIAERHLWGPRLFDDLSADVISVGDDGFYDSSLVLLNELRVTQRLPYGGEVAARLIAAATEDLHGRVAGENIQTATLIFEADVPLLRGAGYVAREDLIQAERNVVYAARDFERFRRVFLVAITTQFLNLVVQQIAIDNAEQQVTTLEGFQEREQALVEAGRTDPFQAALAAQRTLFALDSLNSQRERYRLAVDRFKVRVGMPQHEPLVIVPSTPGLPVPDVNMDEALAAAMAWRLDLQNRRDQLDDARRGINIARNNLLADIDLNASVTLPTDERKRRAGLDFSLDDPIFRAGVMVGFPIDRQIERVNLRGAQIDMERSVRTYDEFRDNVAVEVRNAARDIDRSLFSEDLQARNVEIAQMRLESIEVAPGRADARDRTEAADGLLDAQNDYLAARRDVQLAILDYLLATGQLRVDSDGWIQPLAGMTIDPQSRAEPPAEAAPVAVPDPATRPPADPRPPEPSETTPKDPEPALDRR